MTAKQLKWGETPWDDLSKDELLREVQRMFCALQSARSVMVSCADQEKDALFWGAYGRGGVALSEASQVIDQVYQEYDEASAYHSFFRYAHSLLFDVHEKHRWVVCPECGDMWTGMELLGKPCAESPRRLATAKGSGCKGVFRLLTWEDLKKR